MPLEISNIQASTSKSTACRRHSQRHGCQTSAFWSGNPECHTVLCPGNCHTVPEPAIVTPFWSQQSSHRYGASNRHTVPEPAIVTPFRSQQSSQRSGASKPSHRSGASKPSQHFGARKLSLTSKLSQNSGLSQTKPSLPPTP